MPPRIQKLDHFAIYVTDLERAEEFYSNVLGMSIHARLGNEQVLLKCGDALLALFAKPDLKIPVEPGAPSDPLGRAHFAVKINIEDWVLARKEFLDAGIAMSEEINWGDHDCFYITDPDGNLIELMTYKNQ